MEHFFLDFMEPMHDLTYDLPVLRKKVLTQLWCIIAYIMQP